MKFSDIKPGMKLKAVGDYAECIHVGDEFEVKMDPLGGVFVDCRGVDGEGPSEKHFLAPMADDGSEIPELEPV